MNFNEDSAIAAFCEQFEQLFTTIRELRAQQDEIQQQNQGLAQLIEEEMQNNKQMQQISSEASFHQENTEQNVLDSLNKEIAEKQGILNMLMTQKQQRQVSSQEERVIKAQLNDHMIAIRQEIDQMTQNCAQQGRIVEETKLFIQESTSKIEDYQPKLVQIGENLEDLEQKLKLAVDKNFAQSEDLRTLQNDLRGMLRTQSTVDDAIKEYEKVIAKQWQEIEKKTKRLQILMQNQQQVKAKIQKNKENEVIYNRYRDSNTALATENVMIRDQFQNFVNSLPTELKQKMNPGKKSRSQTQIKASQMRKAFDEAICLNHIKIKELNEVKAQQLKYYEDTQAEVEQLENRLNEYRNNVEILNQQYQTFQQFASKGADSLRYSESKGEPFTKNSEDVKYFDEREFQEYLSQHYPQYSDVKQEN